MEGWGKTLAVRPALTVGNPDKRGEYRGAKFISNRRDDVHAHAAEIRERYAKGKAMAAESVERHSATALAREYGCSAWTIRRICGLDGER